MTWSIVVREPETGRFAIAIATRFLAVGALCPWTRAGVGALSTQAQVNPLYGPGALDRMAVGADAPSAIAEVLADDDGRAHRQVHAIDAAGRNVAHTGDACIPWCGHLVAENISVAGNMLAGPTVVEATLEIFQASADLPLVARLLAAMDAGEAVGGDKRGKQSAAIRIQGPEPYPELDLRVDDHGEPLAELRRITEVAKEVFLPFRAAMPSLAHPSGIYEGPAREQAIRQAIEEISS